MAKMKEIWTFLSITYGVYMHQFRKDFVRLSDQKVMQQNISSKGSVMLFYLWNSPLNPLTSLVNTSDVSHFDDSLLAMHCMSMEQTSYLPFRCNWIPPQVCCRVCVAQSFVFYGGLFVVLSFSPLYCLSFLDLRLLITKFILWSYDWKI